MHKRILDIQGVRDLLLGNVTVYQQGLQIVVAYCWRKLMPA